MNADAAACQSIASLIGLMLATPTPVKKRMPIAVPTRISVGQPNKWEPASELLLIFPKEANDTLWNLEYKEDRTLSLTLGAEKMRKFRDGLFGLPDWNDDYALCPEVDSGRKADRNLWDTQCLWFWTKID